MNEQLIFDFKPGSVMVWTDSIHCWKLLFFDVYTAFCSLEKGTTIVLAAQKLDVAKRWHEFFNEKKINCDLINIVENNIFLLQSPFFVEDKIGFYVFVNGRIGWLVFDKHYVNILKLIS